MATQRFLAAAWASVHGPQEPERLATWVLDRDFAGLMASAAPRAMDWRGLSRVMRDLPFAIAAVRVGGALELPRPEAGSFASTRAADRGLALRALADAVELARSLGCRRVVVDPGTVRVPGQEGPEDLGDPSHRWTPGEAQAQRARRNACLDGALDAACRTLHQAVRSFPDVRLALTGSRHVLGLGEPDALTAIFEDLSNQELDYWHDAPVAARREELLGTPQGEWLERFGARMVGLTLGDSADGGLYLPPGAGGVDYPLLGAYRRRFGRPTPAVVELDPAVDPSEIPGLHAFLSKFGL